MEITLAKSFFLVRKEPEDERRLFSAIETIDSVTFLSEIPLLVGSKQELMSLQSSGSQADSAISSQFWATFTL